jgi:hypothetical protein
MPNNVIGFRPLLSLLSLLFFSPSLLGATFEIKGAYWFNGTGFDKAHWYVNTQGQLSEQPPQQIDYVIEAEGKYVVPPFADAHNHNLQNLWGVQNFAPAQARAGVYYLAQLCDFGKDLRELFHGPDTLDVLYASDCISASDGHPLGYFLTDYQDKREVPEEVLTKARAEYLAVDNLKQLDDVWQKVLLNKPNFIKVILVASEKYQARHGQLDYLGINGIDPELVPAIVERAHGAGLPVLAHVDTAHDVRVAVAAGVDVLAHLPGYRIARNEGFKKEDYIIDDQVISQAARAGVKLIATASVADRNGKLPAAELAEIQEIQKLNLSRMQAAGIPLLMGSDHVFGTVLSEIQYLDALGISSRSALLKSLSMDTPQWLFPDRRLGRFGEGAEASFLILDGDPLENLQALETISLGVKQGNLMSGTPQ